MYTGAEPYERELIAAARFGPDVVEYTKQRYARLLQEFARVLPNVSLHSIYHHVFEARLRLERGNDFAEWLNGLGEKDLAWQITLMDPYTQTMDSLRNRILRMVERRLFEKEHAAA